MQSLRHISNDGAQRRIQRNRLHFELAVSPGHGNSGAWNKILVTWNKNSIKHWMILSSAGHSGSMVAIKIAFVMGFVQNSVYELMLNEYNISCTKMNSKARAGAAFFRKHVMRCG